MCFTNDQSYPTILTESKYNFKLFEFYKRPWPMNIKKN